MNHAADLAAAAGAGVALGTAFFAGLWWTVRRGVASRRPALWIFGSWLLRSALVVAAICFIGRGSWERMTLCVVGFAAARRFVMARIPQAAERAS